MECSKKYNKNINLIRVLACIAILLYHFHLLPGGYLAVCTFFVLSGYLTCISAFKNKKFLVRSYYKKRLWKLYLPLILIVFIVLSILSLCPHITWLNLKPETTSVLLGYNNFWQLSANADYFTRHMNSPFIHLWYISILLQFDLIFPFLFIVLRKIGDRIHKLIPCVITLLLSVIGAIYFYQMTLHQNLMFPYYHSLTRIFSLLFGLSFGFIHTYYGTIIPQKCQKQPISKILFYTYLCILIFLFIGFDMKSTYDPVHMIIVTLITTRCIAYGTIDRKKEPLKQDIIIHFLSTISYEIYLIQYPILFFFQYVSLNTYIKVPIMMICIFCLSFLFHFSIYMHPKYKPFKIIKYILCTFIFSLSLYGGYQYILAQDHTIEMKQLEQQLEQNEKKMQQRQEEYTAQLKQEEMAWSSIVEDLEQGETKLRQMITELSVVGVGDSVMLGAIDPLYETFPNGYFDAKVSRTTYVVNGILEDLKLKNALGNPIILNLGANGDCPDSVKIEIIQTCEDRNLFWINVTNDQDVHVNDKLFALSKQYDNLHIIDWNTISTGHPEYFYADGIHLTGIGRKAYADAIYDAIYQVYLKEYQEKKEAIIKQHEEEQKTKISFYGNDMLLNAFHMIQEDFKEAKFNIHSSFDYESLKSELEQSINDHSLTHRIVFVFDHPFSLSASQYQTLIELCVGHEIIILSTTEDLDIPANEQVTVLDFYQEIKNHNDYMMADRIHLTEDGNQALYAILRKTLK